MSQSRVRRPPEPPPPIVWWPLALGSVAVLIVLAALYLTVNWIHSFPSPRETTTGTILEIRRVVDTIRDTTYGGKIGYRFEAHVQYVADGQRQDRWLRASDDLPRESLLIKLANHPTECLVYWPPGHPEDARCSLK